MAHGDVVQMDVAGEVITVERGQRRKLRSKCSTGQSRTLLSCRPHHMNSIQTYKIVYSTDQKKRETHSPSPTSAGAEVEAGDIDASGWWWWWLVSISEWPSERMTTSRRS